MATRLSVSDAATHLSVSVYTIKRRLKTGSLAGSRDNTGRWFVLLSDDVRPAIAGPELAASEPVAAIAEVPLATGERSPSQLQQPLQQHDSELVAELRSQIAHERAETARRFTEVQSMHLDAIGRMQAQAAVERSLWLERIDAADCRAEAAEARAAAVEDKLHLVLDRLLERQYRPWWSKLFGDSKKTSLNIKKIIIMLGASSAFVVSNALADPVCNYWSEGLKCCPMFETDVYKNEDSPYLFFEEKRAAKKLKTALSDLGYGLVADMAIDDSIRYDIKIKREDVFQLEMWIISWFGINIDDSYFGVMITDARATLRTIAGQIGRCIFSDAHHGD